LAFKRECTEDVLFGGDGRNWVCIFHKTRHVCRHEITVTDSN
jgi:hypothetical protein